MKKESGINTENNITVEFARNRISDIPQKTLDEHFADEIRPAKNAYMTREEFLEKYNHVS